MSTSDNWDEPYQNTYRETEKPAVKDIQNMSDKEIDEFKLNRQKERLAEKKRNFKSYCRDISHRAKFLLDHVDLLETDQIALLNDIVNKFENYNPYVFSFLFFIQRAHRKRIR